MAGFQFQASDASGQPVTGELQAESIEAARKELLSRGWQIQDLAESIKSNTTESTSIGQLSRSDTVTLAQQIANIASDGLPLSSGLRALADEGPNRRIRNWLRTVSQRVDSGQSLESMTVAGDGAWPRYFQAMFDAGLRTGRLAEVLNECVVHLRSTSDLWRSLWIGLAYPAALIMVLWFLFSFLVSFITPHFKSIFLGFGTELPAITVFLIDISDAIRGFDWWSFPASVVLIALLWWLSPRFRLDRPRDAFVRRIPGFGDARRTGALAEFFRLLSLLARAQVAMPEAVRVAAASLGDADLRAACVDVAKRVEAGQSLADAAALAGCFPPESLQMFRWTDHGELLANGLQKAGEVLAIQSRIHSQSLVIVCAPTVMVIVGLGVGFTVLALFMPLVKLLNDLS